MSATFLESLNAIFARTFDVTSTPLYVFPGLDRTTKALSTDDDPEDDNDFGWKYHELAGMEACVVRIDPSDANYASSPYVYLRYDGFSARVGLDKVSEYASAADAMPASSSYEGWIRLETTSSIVIRGHANLQRLRMYAPAGTVTIAVETHGTANPGKD